MLLVIVVVLELRAVARFRVLCLVRQDGGPDQNLGHSVGVAVGRWSSVLQVALTIFCHLSWDPDTGSSVSHTSGEVVDAGGLVVTSQTSGVVLALAGVIGLDVTHMVLRQLLNGVLD